MTSGTAYRDLRGLPVVPTGLCTVGDRALTHEQVRMLRDLWVVGALEDGYTETGVLCIMVLRDHERSRVLELSTIDLFTCDPQEEQNQSLARDANDPPPSRRARVIATTLGASLRRLVDESHVKMHHAADTTT